MPLETNLTKAQRDSLQAIIEASAQRKRLTAADIKTAVPNCGPVAKLVRDLQTKGFPICQAGSSYFYARTAIELSNFIAELEDEALRGAEVITGLKNAYPAVGAGTTAEISFTKKLYVRNSDGSVGQREFKLDAIGQPIIPEGTQLI